MKICVIGTYWKEYSRNKALINGLCDVGVDIKEVNIPVGKKQLDRPGDLSIVSVISRIWTKLITSLKMLRHMKDIKEANAVLVLFPGHLDLPIVWILTRIAGKKLIFDGCMSLYDMMVNDKKVVEKNRLSSRLIKIIEHWLLKLPDAVFVDTEEMKKFVTKELGVDRDNMFVVPLGANEEIYKPNKTKKSDQGLSVVFFGLYNPLQGTDTIVRAAKLLKEHPSIRLIMIGEGQQKEKALKYCNQNRLTNVEFVDFIPENELVRYIQQSDVMLGIFGDSDIAKRVIPNKIYAALACKKPLITGKTPAVESEFTHGKELWMCSPADAASLAQAIEELSLRPALRNSLAHRGYEKFIKNFGQKVIAQTFVSQVEARI